MSPYDPKARRIPKGQPKMPHQHEQWQLREAERGMYCAACGEYASFFYPEHEKLKLVSDKSQAIGEFLEGLGSWGIVLHEFSTEDGRYYPITTPIQTLLARHFDIDQQALENEKQAMLEKMRQG